MALTLHPSSAFATHKLHHLPLHSPLRSFPLCRAKPTSLSIIRSQHDSSQSSEPAAVSTQNPFNVSPPPPTQPASSGQGFGPTSGKSNRNQGASDKKQKEKRERASIIRRAPIQKPHFVSQQQEVPASEAGRYESAFLLAWLGLGAIILLEGIALAASGFLPEEWDNLFVKYLYPSFTPTVFLFVAGTVAYGVLKYLQNEKLRNEE